MLLGLTFPGQMKQKNETKRHVIARVHSEQYSPKKQRTVVVYVSAVEMSPDLMMGSPFEAYYMSCQGSTLSPKQFSISQPKIITFMWQLTAIISSDLLRFTQGKKKRNHTPTHAFSSPKSWYFYSRNNIITRTLNHLQGLHSDDLLYTCTTVAEYQMWAISNGAACHKVWYECAAQWNTRIDHILL